jgi:hypothetical protein
LIQFKNLQLPQDPTLRDRKNPKTNTMTIKKPVRSMLSHLI